MNFCLISVFFFLPFQTMWQRIMLTSLCPSPLEGYIFRGGIAGAELCVVLSLSACSVAQSYPTLCNPMNCSPPGSCVRGIVPDKNTGVGCPFLLWVYVYSCCLMRSIVVEPICTPTGRTCECLLFHGLTNRGRY